MSLSTWPPTSPAQDRHWRRISARDHSRTLPEMSAALNSNALPFDGLRATERDQTVNPELQTVTVNEELNVVWPEFTVIIPTRNEVDNIEPLLDRLAAALAGTAKEFVFVDSYCLRLE